MIGGDRSAAITIANSDTNKAKKKVEYEFGASEKSLSTK